MKHLPLRECGYAIAVVVAVCLLYGGAYLALVEVVEREDLRGAMRRPGDRHDLPGTPREISPPTCVARYRIGNDWAKAFFSPIHELDRRVRPDYWGEPR